MKKFLFCFITMLAGSLFAKAQEKDKILLTDPELQFEITEAVNAMYNFKFSTSDSLFRIFRDRYKNHPLPYFLLGYSQYWRIQPNENIELYDDRFYAYMDSVIEFSDKLYDRDEKNFEAIFFLTAAYAFKGKIQSDRKNWVSATNSGRKALKYLEKSKEFNDLSPEFLFGKGLFYYFREWIPENYPAFKPVLWFFPKGDKEKGLRFLKECTENAFYTRVEAQNFLIQLYLFEEKKYTDALPIAKYLHETYPDNPVFHRMYARVLFSQGKTFECLTQSEEILRRIEAQKPGYEEVSGRYASFFIGWFNKYLDPSKSKSAFLKTVYFAEKIGAVKMNYYLYALAELAQIADKEKDKEKALLYYKKIKDNANHKNDIYKTSKKYLKEND